MIRKIAIYTRYSTDMQREESCEDQEREVRRGLERLGIDARDAVVLHDRAESGTRSDRANFERLRAMIARGEVSILAVDDQARLSRADNACGFITDLVYHGGRFVSTGEGIDTAQEGWQLRVKVMELQNSTAIRELGRRVHRGQKGRVLDDGAAGDHPYGYESYHLDPSWAETSRRGPKPKKGLRVAEAEASWVRQVFDWFADGGMSIAAIARELTRLEVDKGSKSTTPDWHRHQVRRMLENEKYSGRWGWGKTKVLRNSEGKTKQVPVPADQQVVRDRPDLRIIDSVTWERVQRRLAELGDQFGLKPGDKPRGPKVHHTSVYPISLLGGLVYCRACGSRLWIRGSGQRTYLGCPSHGEGTCEMATQVPLARAEAAVLGLVAELLTSWPGWVESASASLRRAVAEVAAGLPTSIRADQGRLAELERRIGNLVDQLSDGAGESTALRHRLDQLEREVDELRRRVAEAIRVQTTAVAMPDDAWIKGRLADLSPHLADDPRRAAPLLRRLLRRVEAEGVVAPGKVRGFARLHIRVDPGHLLEEALGGRLPEAVLGAVPAPDGGAREFALDLGGPTRRDVLAPEIAAMRARGMKWPEIGRATGLGTGNAHNVWRRWIDAQPRDERDRA